LRVVDVCVSLAAIAPLFGGCGREPAPTDGPRLASTGPDPVCAAVRAELGTAPEALRAQRRSFRERVTARFGAPAFAALRASYGGRCEDDADLRCAIDEVGPFARVDCQSPSRHVPEALYADGATLRRADGVEAFELGVRSATPSPTELDPVLAYFQRVTGAVVLREKGDLARFVPAADVEAMRPSSAALVPATLASGTARFLAYENRGYQAPRALLEVRVDLAQRVVAVERVALAPVPFPAVGQEPPRLATTEGARYDGSEGAVCAWGERRGDRRGLPAPAACRAGLRCCSGGAAGSDGVCTRTGLGDCPIVP
jgi:hypothetical protein